ncbi:CatB-related O-acetyltransferase [Bacillus xiapuensis]|uniref:CatB-related O-acetyltransferase n=1 Tax=Bacillus xiapuensis TaxID=2014075 RepID=UPI000C243BB2|nr:CatB-related O-acetyltransferase [Bacillus xiapuensis]
MNEFPDFLHSQQLKETISHPNIQVGKHTYYSGYYHKESFQDYCVRYLLEDEEGDKLIIGKFCAIGSGACFIMSGNKGHRPDWISTYPFYYVEKDWGEAVDGYQAAGDTVVGNDVWIGTEAMIMPGVKIGDGAIVSARSVVTSDVPPYAIVAGNPAKVVKKRFSDSEIEQLLKLKWWDWPEQKIMKNIELICSENIEQLLNK